MSAPPKKKKQRTSSSSTNSTTMSLAQETPSVLFKELSRVEKLKRAKSLSHANKILTSLSTKAAKVAYALSKVPTEMYSKYLDMDSKGPTSDHESLSAADRATVLLLYNLKENPCCRCPKDRSVGGVPATILSVMEPLMIRHPRPTKLSQIAVLLDLLFTFNFIDHRSNERVDMNKWEKCGDYFTLVAEVPLASTILDPAYILIRLQGGGAAPAAAIDAVNNIPVGGPVGTALTQNPVPFPVAGAGNATSLPGLFELGNKHDSGIIIAALTMWGAVQVPAVNLEMLRFTPDPTGIELF